MRTVGRHRYPFDQCTISVQKNVQNSQNIQPGTRPRDARAKAHSAIAERAEIHAAPERGPLQRPHEREPPNSEHGDSQDINRDAKLGFENTFVTARKRLGGEVAQGTGYDTENASEQGAGEEVAVLADGEEVGRGREDLG